MTDYRILIADDHSLMRQGIRRIIENSPNLTVVGEAGDGLALLHLLRHTAADLVLLDISMPRLRGLEAIQEVKVLSPGVKVLILTMHKRIAFLHEAMSAGADGYLLKDDTEKALIGAITTIREGRTYLSPTLSEAFQKSLFTQWRTGTGGLAENDPLSNREREVLKLIAEGKSNKEAADLLCISPKTVEHHRASIMRKLALKNVADLTRFAIRKGYVSSE